MKGWGAQDDFQAQIEQTIADRLASARIKLRGAGQKDCDECEQPIPEARRKAVPSAIRCVKCESLFELGMTFTS